MISLEQIRLLESRITKAVKVIEMLREENGALKRSVDAAQKRMQELEALVSEFKADQEEIEQSLLRAIHNLDRLEDGMEAGAPPRGGGSPPAGPAEDAGAPEKSPRGGAAEGGAPAPQASAAPGSPPEDGEVLLFADPPDGEKKQELDIF